MKASFLRPMVSGVILIFHFGNLAAVIDNAGRLVWRNHAYPIFLIEYLIENQPNPNDRWN